MKYLFRLSVFALATTTLAFTGCAKRPRPNPSQTVMGSSQNAGLNPEGVLTNDPEFPLIARDPLDMAEGERGVLPSVLFDFDSASIRPAERSKLTQAAQFLRENANARLKLEGHCDWRGTTEYNMGLGDRRANAVRSFLTNLGLSADRLLTLSRGDLDARDNATAEQMQQDRRVELVVLR